MTEKNGLKLLLIIISLLLILWVCSYFITPFLTIDRSMTNEDLLNQIYICENQTYSLIFLNNNKVKKDFFDSNVKEIYSFTLNESIIELSNEEQLLILKDNKLFSLSDKNFLYMQ